MADLAELSQKVATEATDVKTTGERLEQAKAEHEQAIHRYEDAVRKLNEALETTHQGLPGVNHIPING